MTDQESEHVRTLFQRAGLEDVSASRDLIGPAIAWGTRRRRRDRWTAAVAVGAVAAVALVTVVATRPDIEGAPRAVAPGYAAAIQSSAKTSAASTPTPTSALPVLSGTIPQRRQQLLDALQPYLPAGTRIACDRLAGESVCTSLMVTGPTGSSIARWASGTNGYAPNPAALKYIHPHKATAAIPLVSGNVGVPGGSVQVTSYDEEAQESAGDKTKLTDPTALIFHTAVYEFVPAGATQAFSMELSEMVRDVPWKSPSTEPDAGQIHALWGYNQNGPVLSPQDFARLAAAPIFPLVLRQMTELNADTAKNPPGASSSTSQ